MRDPVTALHGTLLLRCFAHVKAILLAPLASVSRGRRRVVEAGGRLRAAGVVGSGAHLEDGTVGVCAPVSGAAACCYVHGLCPALALGTAGLHGVGLGGQRARACVHALPCSCHGLFPKSLGLPLQVLKELSSNFDDDKKRQVGRYGSPLTVHTSVSVLASAFSRGTIHSCASALRDRFSATPFA